MDRKQARHAVMAYIEAKVMASTVLRHVADAAQSSVIEGLRNGRASDGKAMASLNTQLDIELALTESLAHEMGLTTQQLNDRRSAAMVFTMAMAEEVPKANVMPFHPSTYTEGGES